MNPMNPKQYVEAMIRYRNQQVAERELRPWQPAARARFYAEHFAETLRAAGFRAARTWQPEPEKEHVRVYLGGDRYVAFSRDGPALTDGGRVAYESLAYIRDIFGRTRRTPQATFRLDMLYPSQRRAWLDAVASYTAWQTETFDAFFTAHEEFLEALDQLAPDDPDFLQYALHLLDRQAI